jgi:hypothetical protein
MAAYLSVFGFGVIVGVVGWSVIWMFMRAWEERDR